MGKKCVCQTQIYNYQRKIYNIFEHKIRDERDRFLIIELYCVIIFSKNYTFFELNNFNFKMN